MSRWWLGSTRAQHLDIRTRHRALAQDKMCDIVNNQRKRKEELCKHQLVNTHLSCLLCLEDIRRLKAWESCGCAFTTFDSYCMRMFAKKHIQHTRAFGAQKRELHFIRCKISFSCKLLTIFSFKSQTHNNLYNDVSHTMERASHRERSNTFQVSVAFWAFLSLENIVLLLWKSAFLNFFVKSDGFLKKLRFFKKSLAAPGRAWPEKHFSGKAVLWKNTFFRMYAAKRHFSNFVEKKN